ncbi:uncharacterized protein I303_102609 [Kwoniella dejecticola CBS 10117]|uniref:Uncharacterized protein n=1 Tax=Kwoniella dejecticola CBS 10117 TaxID=1296121 RepID=A0A1A6A982_9TREE|nr:uncharacterized protein I303_02623 [Kwoniella dejecticola CBS 10117]OBR86614.1 hypothetical protein I303_02623 [Kwoniella dejecticola CBS 10117]
MAARAVQSAGTNVYCYFACPETVDGTSLAFVDSDSHDYYDDAAHYNSCYYAYQKECKYNDDGTQYISPSPDFQNPSSCPETAPAGPCQAGGNPDRNAYFRKRAVPRALTPAEQRLAARQYRPRYSRRSRINDQ